MFVKIYSRLQIKNVIDLSMCHAPGDYIKSRHQKRLFIHISAG